MLYEEVHVGSVREAIGILDRFFLEYPINDMSKEAWKLIRANLKEARMMSILDEYSFPTYLEGAALVFLEAMENAEDSEDDEREMTNGSV